MQSKQLLTLDPKLRMTNKQSDPPNEYVEKHPTRPQQGYIPSMERANQHSHMVIRDFCQISNLWLLGVMDGHGINGHLVSQFVQAQLPAIMNGLLAGLPPEKAIKQEPQQSI